MSHVNSYVYCILTYVFTLLIVLIVLFTGTRTTSSISSSTSASSTGLKMRTCVGCGGQIHDQFILQVAPNLEWHAACLKCSQCHKFLDEKCTCFVRDGKCFVYIMTTTTDRPASSLSYTSHNSRAGRP